MTYLSVREVAETWEVSEAMIRKYCTQKRIPGAKQKGGVWVIPDTAKKPVGRMTAPPRYEKLHPIALKLVRQKTKKIFHGLYDYVQINLAYSSSRMASNRLTRNQVDTIFRKGKVRESFEPMKVSDLIEVMNHCVCTDYIIDNLEKPLNIKFIKALHHMLMYGTVDDRKNKVIPGEFRNAYSNRKQRYISPYEQITDRLQQLIEAYESLDMITEREILAFHVQFERISPFEDGNGRIGRLILFKECLRHNIMPFILDDKKRTRYLQGLRDWDLDPDVLITVVAESQNIFKHQIELQNLGEYREALFNVQDEEYEEEDDDEE